MEAGKVEICRVSSGSCGGWTTCLPSLLCSISHTRHFPSEENKRQERCNEYDVTLTSRRAILAFRSMTIYLGHMSECIIAFLCHQIIHYFWFDLICLPFLHISQDFLHNILKCQGAFMCVRAGVKTICTDHYSSDCLAFDRSVLLSLGCAYTSISV